MKFLKNFSLRFSRNWKFNKASAKACFRLSKLFNRVLGVFYLTQKAKSLGKIANTTVNAPLPEKFADRRMRKTASGKAQSNSFLLVLVFQRFLRRWRSVFPLYLCDEKVYLSRFVVDVINLFSDEYETVSLFLPSMLLYSLQYFMFISQFNRTQAGGSRLTAGNERHFSKSIWKMLFRHFF